MKSVRPSYTCSMFDHSLDSPWSSVFKGLRLFSFRVTAPWSFGGSCQKAYSVSETSLYPSFDVSIFATGKRVVRSFDHTSACARSRLSGVIMRQYGASSGIVKPGVMSRQGRQHHYAGSQYAKAEDEKGRSRRINGRHESMNLRLSSLHGNKFKILYNSGCTDFDENSWKRSI